MNNSVSNIEDCLSDFSSISLAELENYELLNRYDIKYIININKLPLVLKLLQSNYYILQICDKRIFSYNNLYFDTQDYYFYNQHHNGKSNRTKVRYREYIESGISFFEIKNKINFYKTAKNRIRINNISDHLSSHDKDFIKTHLNVNPELLTPKLSVSYKRMTLLHINEKIEKITIDTNLNFKNESNTIKYSQIAIIEIKLNKYTHFTPLLDSFHRLKIFAGIGFSKYCIGLALTDRNVKYNRFKPKLHIVNKLIDINE
mgnify:CR=1 FL=1